MRVMPVYSNVGNYPAQSKTSFGLKKFNAGGLDLVTPKQREMIKRQGTMNFLGMPLENPLNKVVEFILNGDDKTLVLENGCRVTFLGDKLAFLSKFNSKNKKLQTKIVNAAA